MPIELAKTYLQTVHFANYLNVYGHAITECQEVNHITFTGLLYQQLYSFIFVYIFNKFAVC